MKNIKAHVSPGVDGLYNSNSNLQPENTLDFDQNRKWASDAGLSGHSLAQRGFSMRSI